MTAPLADGLHPVPRGKLACIVTSLAMRASPDSLKPVPLPPGFSLLRATTPDAQGYKALFRRIGEPWLWTSRLSLSDDALSAIIGDEKVEVWMLLEGDRPGGLVELDFRVAGECELAFFGLARDLTRRGLGRAMMSRAIARAFAHPIGRVWVHTCSLDDPAALPFYMRAGFVPFRTDVEVADDPRRLGLLPPEAAPQVPML